MTESLETFLAIRFASLTVADQPDVVKGRKRAAHGKDAISMQYVIYLLTTC
jgi:hypothetical protein